MMMMRCRGGGGGGAPSCGTVDSNNTEFGNNNGSSGNDSNDSGNSNSGSSNDNNNSGNSSSGNDNSNSGNSSSGNSTCSSISSMQACAACKHQRRKCSAQCPLAPYFPAQRSREFRSVHRLFGVSNVLRMLRRVHPSARREAVGSIVYEAEAWVRDPVFGCVGSILLLQLRAQHLRLELSLLRHRAFDLLLGFDPSIASQPPLDSSQDLTNDDEEVEAAEAEAEAGEAEAEADEAEEAEEDRAIVPSLTFADDSALHGPIALYAYGGHEERYDMLHGWDGERLLYDFNDI